MEVSAVKVVKFALRSMFKVDFIIACYRLGCTMDDSCSSKMVAPKNENQ